MDYTPLPVQFLVKLTENLRIWKLNKFSPLGLERPDISKFDFIDKKKYGIFYRLATNKRNIPP